MNWDTGLRSTVHKYANGEFLTLKEYKEAYAYKIGANFYEFVDHRNDCIVYKLHLTKIMKCYKDRIEIDLGYWDTILTRKWVNFVLQVIDANISLVRIKGATYVKPTDADWKPKECLHCFDDKRTFTFYTNTLDYICRIKRVSITNKEKEA